jgi:uncharacterized repeat protein (TIGR01451 family)
VECLEDRAVPTATPTLHIAETGLTSLQLGKTAAFTVTVSNTGSATANSVTIDDTLTLPAGTSFVSGTGGSWHHVSGNVYTVAVTKSTLAASASVKLTFIVKVDPTASRGLKLTNDVTAEATNASTVTKDFPATIATHYSFGP